MIFKGLFDFKNQGLNVQWRIIFPIFFLIFIGLLILSSTSGYSSFTSSTFYKQILWFLFGFIAFIITQYVRVQYLYDYSYVMYILLLIFLSLTLFSEEIEGAARWIVIGPFYIQPSEFGKIIYIICIARFFSDNRNKNSFSLYLIIVLLLATIPPLLVFVQPDLGTAILYLSIIMPLIFWSDFKEKLIFLIIAPIFSIITVAFAEYYDYLLIFYIWMLLFLLYLFYSRFKISTIFFNFIINVLIGLSGPIIWTHIFKQHHRDRILFFLDPFKEPLGRGYQAIQSWISIGSGGLWGKGLGNGTQKSLNFLPVKDTDFIISVIGEEFGFITILFLLLAVVFFIYWILEFLTKIESNFSSLLLLGFSSLIFMHIIINMSIVSGLLPITGLPVPFISYGGSFFLTCSILVGLCNNIINNDI